MRCKKHISDHSSSIGVCASCLRSRLFSLIQSQSQSQSQSQTHPIPISNPNPQTKPISDPNNPPPLIFPRSVSPYISRRKSEPIQRFYFTPQHNPKPNLPKKPKFGLISRLFRSRSGKPDPNSIPADPISATSSSSSTFVYISNRGMSPEHHQFSEPSPARGFFRRPSPGKLRPGGSRSGIAFCLSPLVRASPSRLWAESAYSGENRVSEKSHLSSAASICKNRSRKIVDFGRLNLNR